MFIDGDTKDNEKMRGRST